MNDDGAPARLDRERLSLGMSVPQLWLEYFALGGSMTPSQLGEALSGAAGMGAYDHDLVVQALNERHLEVGNTHRLAYADELNAGP